MECRIYFHHIYTPHGIFSLIRASHETHGSLGECKKILASVTKKNMASVANLMKVIEKNMKEKEGSQFSVLRFRFRVYVLFLCEERLETALTGF